MIVLEGPDGGGKTTLLRQLTAEYKLPQRPRFATSMGPLDNLYDRVYTDFAEVFAAPHKCEVYDRHSLISEYVYGLGVRGVVPVQFLYPSASLMLHEIAKRSLLVLCLPPRPTVRDNMTVEDQMDGVHNNIDLIYTAYELVRVWWPNPTNLIVYDYTKPHSVNHAHNRIMQHSIEWNRHV